MKKTVICVLVITLMLTLCGCGGGEEAKYEEFRQRLAAANELGFTARLSAEFTEKTESFTLSFFKDSEGCTVEILEPESVRGIKAHVAADGTRLEYDGVILDVGKLTDRGLTPMSALPLLVTALNDAHIVSAVTENELLCVTLEPEDELIIKLWLDGDTLAPVNAEMIYEGVSVIFAEIENWSIN